MSQTNVGSDNQNRPRNDHPDVIIQKDILIVGAGPAGASLACFLASYGIKGIVVSRAPGTADTPRAHITNMAAMECLRDIGLDVEAEHQAIKGGCMQHTRWCHSMAGEEYARIHSWGNDPKRKGDYDVASPCDPCDLPQTLLEPILVSHAIRSGYQVRFNTSFMSFAEENDGRIITTLKDDLSGTTYKIRSKYLFGADGARSRIARQLDLPFEVKPGGGLAINVLVKADLSHLVKNRMGNLHWIMQPENDTPDYASMGIVRMVKPWHEWMFILFPKPGYDTTKVITKEQYVSVVRSFIGDDTPADIISISNWNINETVAMKYSKSNKM
jgi:2-polyprenyl-6-methoxyphenol hydroxylase-like FAD-dependent oxidoreductase